MNYSHIWPRGRLGRKRTELIDTDEVGVSNRDGVGVPIEICLPGVLAFRNHFVTAFIKAPAFQIQVVLPEVLAFFLFASAFWKTMATAFKTVL